MNKEIIYLNGKCVVEDENRKRRVEDYTDKTEEILVTENVIETLGADLEENRYELGKRKKLVKNGKFDIIFTAVSFALIPPVIQLLLIFLLGPGASLMLAQPSFLLPFLKVFILSVTALFGGMLTYSSYSSYRKNKRKISGLLSEKKAIEETLDQEKAHLIDLQLEKKKVVASEEYFEKEVPDLEELRDLRNYLDLYYDCGYHKEKYGRYLQNGKLEKKLGKYYNEKGLELIEGYLEEQGYSRRLTK